METTKVYEVRTFHNSREFVFEGRTDGESNGGMLRVLAPHPDQWQANYHSTDCICGCHYESEDGKPVELIF